MSDGLLVENLSAGYGEARVVVDAAFALAPGRSLALLGRNGAGKTTLLNALIGVNTRHGGRVVLDGRDLTALAPHRRALAGLGWTPQERAIFRSLTVEENLTAIATPGPWTPERVYALFPRLKERRTNGGRQLSGGEQQMLAVGRALTLNPKVLLLDEPTEGLAPILVDELLAALRALARDGLSMIVVEQKARKILPFVDDAIVLERGRIVHRAASADLLAHDSALAAMLTASGKS